MSLTSNLPRECPFLGEEQGSLIDRCWGFCVNGEFDEFERLFEQARVDRGLAPRELAALYFIRGGYKVHFCDVTLLQDFQEADRLLTEPLRLSTNYEYLGPDPMLLRRIRPHASSLYEYRVAVERSTKILGRIVDSPGIRMIGPIITSEIYYMLGKVENAVALATPIFYAAETRRIYHMAAYSAFVMLRCAVVQGNQEWFMGIWNSLNQMFKPRPEYQELYGLVTGWVNAVTGYLGKTPRYTVLPNGLEIPNIDARTAYRMEQKRINQIGEMPDPVPSGENPLIPLHDAETHLYHAMMMFKHCEPDEAVRHFRLAHAITRENRIYMPYVEYGEQIIPLLRHAMKCGVISRPNMDKLIAMCEDYEKTLRLIRGGADEFEELGLPEGLFTKAELRVLRFLCEGKSTAEIAGTLDVQPGTVTELSRRVFRKMHVQGKKEAVEKAARKQYFT